MGYIEPTPIQLRAIPPILAGDDVIGSAQTGTGKTAAFALPLLTKLTPGGPIRTLIVVPTRELAAQIESAFRAFARFTNFRIGTVFGGVGYGNQKEMLRKGLDILVATPGRLLDLVTQNVVKLNQVQYLILDEADRMLDMGFLPDVKRIVRECPPQRQTMLFSATIPPEIESLISWAMRNPKTIEVGGRRTPAAGVKHVLYPVAQDQKTDLLQALLDRVDYQSAIVFCRTKHGADRVGRMLKKNNHSVAILHSNRTQREREQALRGFRDGRYEVLVATDIASRGLDVPEVSHVINYDVPHHPEDYVHRIGRTARSNATGDAFTLMTAEDSRHVAAIERYVSQKIERVKLENFSYNYSQVFEAPRTDDKSSRPSRVVGARIRGGYYFGHSRRRR